MDNPLCIGIIVIVTVIFIWRIYDGYQNRRKVENARYYYQESLEKHKAQPNDVNLRQQTLALGREYARAARDDGNETIFDEIALMNDLNAIDARVQTKSESGKDKEKSASNRLKELNEMKNQGLISEEEYNAKRADILDNI